MKTKNNELIEELLHTFRNFKRIRVQNHASSTELSHNEKMVLFIIYDVSKNNIVPLSEIRERIRLAPSTITPIITSLEEKGLIERNIDKSDRRNIFLRISPMGVEYTNKVQSEIRDIMSKYIEYIGEEDTKQLIKLISKTTDFFSGKEER